MAPWTFQCRFDRWERIPRHPDWKWEYFDGAAQLSYRPRPLHVRRSTSEPVSTDHRHAVQLLRGPDDAMRAFLRTFWAAHDPYRCVPDPDEWLDDDLSGSFARLAEPGGAVVEEDGQIIGAVLVEQPHRDETAPYLAWLSVRAGFRCDGVGTAMLAAIVPAHAAAGVPYLDSGASVANRASIVWHWRNGFEALPDPYVRFSGDSRRA